MKACAETVLFHLETDHPVTDKSSAERRIRDDPRDSRSPRPTSFAVPPNGVCAPLYPPNPIRPMIRVPCIRTVESSPGFRPSFWCTDVVTSCTTSTDILGENEYPNP